MPRQSIIKKDDKKWYHDNRFEHYKYVEEVINPLIHHSISSGEKKIATLGASVKTGKRTLVILAKLLNNENIIHLFISAFHRVSEENQRIEFGINGIRVHSINNKNTANKCINTLQLLRQNRDIKIVIHMDEHDFGSGKKQLLKKVYQEAKENPRE